MKTALDNYALGKQQEVSADSYSYIIRDQNRFICPECFESVTMVDGKLSRFFKHHKKSASSIECERRVESSANQSISKRVGLPLFLRKDNKKYVLCMGFRPLPESLIQLCSKEKVYVEISSKNRPKFQKYYINNLNFDSSNITYKEIEFLEPNNLVVKFSNQLISKQLCSYWSDYIETSIINRGALFLNGNNGGKIVRVGDCVSAYKSYLWVRPKYSHSFYYGNYSESYKFKKVGDLVVDKMEYEVYEGQFEVHSSDSKRFENVARYLQTHLKVFLLDSESSVSPLWPPCIRTEIGFHPLKQNDLYLSVSSNNEYPKIYVYNNNSPTPNCILPKKSGNSFIGKVYASSVDKIVNVDRKVISNGKYIKAKQIVNDNKNKYLDDLDVCYFTIDRDCCETINTGAITEVYLIDNNYQITKSVYDDGLASIDLGKKTCLAVVICNNHLVAIYSPKTENINKKLSVDYNEVMHCIKTSKNITETQLNASILKKIILLIEKDSRFNGVFEPYIKKNRIPVSLVNVLRKDNKNGQ